MGSRTREGEVRALGWAGRGAGGDVDYVRRGSWGGKRTGRRGGGEAGGEKGGVVGGVGGGAGRTHIVFKKCFQNLFKTCFQNIFQNCSQNLFSELFVQNF